MRSVSVAAAAETTIRRGEIPEGRSRGDPGDPVDSPRVYWFLRLPKTLSLDSVVAS
jgi:hypothetical protein